MKAFYEKRVVSLRYIIIGDIHGCYDELIALLLKVNFDDKKDVIIFLGDYTDRGKQSYEVYRFLKALRQDMGDRCIMLYGNHEELIDNFHDHKDLNWLLNGGRETLKSFKEHNVSLNRYTKFIANNTHIYFACKKFQACHAGVENKPMEDQYEEVLLWDRSAVEKGFYNGLLTIVGHTPVTKPTWIGKIDGKVEHIKLKEKTWYNLPATGIINIDTGCGKGGSLSALVIQGTRFCTYTQDKLPDIEECLRR